MNCFFFVGKQQNSKNDASPVGTTIDAYTNQKFVGKTGYVDLVDRRPKTACLKRYDAPFDVFIEFSAQEHGVGTALLGKAIDLLHNEDYHVLRISKATKLSEGFYNKALEGFVETKKISSFVCRHKEEGYDYEIYL